MTGSESSSKQGEENIGKGYRTLSRAGGRKRGFELLFEVL